MGSLHEYMNAYRKAKGDIKYVICNADEGNPGAYMDRNILEDNLTVF